MKPKRKKELMGIRKECPHCQKITNQIIRTLSSKCTVCETDIDDDGDELFGPVDEVTE